MTIQNLPRHIDLKTTMTLQPQKQAGAHRIRPAGLLRDAARDCGGLPKVVR